MRYKLEIYFELILSTMFHFAATVSHSIIPLLLVLRMRIGSTTMLKCWVENPSALALCSICGFYTCCFVCLFRRYRGRNIQI